METGPPVEVQVSMNTGGSVAGSVSNWKVISPGIVTCPVGIENRNTITIEISTSDIVLSSTSQQHLYDIIYFSMGPTY